MQKKLNFFTLLTLKILSKNFSFILKSWEKCQQFLVKKNNFPEYINI